MHEGIIYLVNWRPAVASIVPGGSLQKGEENDGDS